ncbi:ROK family protein, partial [Phocaeicola vulgatus]
MVTGMEKPYVVGMDIGGTNTVFGIVDSRGNVLATDSVKTQSFSKIEDYVEAVSSK